LRKAQGTRGRKGHPHLTHKTTPCVDTSKLSAHPHTRTHTHTHTHARTRMHTRTHTHMHTHIHIPESCRSRLHHPRCGARWPCSAPWQTGSPGTKKRKPHAPYKTVPTRPQRHHANHEGTGTERKRENKRQGALLSRREQRTRVAEGAVANSGSGRFVFFVPPWYFLSQFPRPPLQSLSP
jgi:hypothetical protein